MGVKTAPLHLLTALLLTTSLRDLPWSPASATHSDFYIEVVVSPLVRQDMIAEIRLIWESRRFLPGDRLVLYRSGDVIFQYEPPGCSGYIDTGAFLGETNLTSFITSCSIYSAAYLQDNRTMAYSCLQNSPTWMSDLRSDIENFSLSDLFIPGTHDSASYVVSKTGYFENILQKYVYTQDASVLDQLVMGVRYLDLRIGFYNHTIGEPPYQWWCNHDFMPVQPLSSVIHQVRQFVTRTNEIVVVDLHNFPVGFSDSEIHHKLGKYLLKELGDLLHPKTELDFRTKLRDIWSSGKRVILSYNRDIVADTYGFYPPIKHSWGNRQTFGELYSFLSTQFEGCERNKSRKMWTAMAELTPTTLGVLTDWYGGLRQLADRVNTNLTLAFRSCRQWYLCSNVVAVDFFRSTGLVGAAVTINKERAKARH